MADSVDVHTVAAPQFYSQNLGALEPDDENVVNPNLQCCGKPLLQCTCSGKRSKPQPEEQRAA